MNANSPQHQRPWIGSLKMRRAPGALLRSCGIGLLLISAAIAQVLVDSAVGADESRRPIQYRRIFVPADNVAAWPYEGRKLLPIDEREFNALSSAANAASVGRSSSPAILEARYTARLEDNSLVEGRGHWVISRRDEEGAAFLPLEDSSLILSDAQWHEAPEQPVRLGKWGHNGGAAERFGLEVPKAGKLTFAWRTRTKLIQNDVEVDARFPDANTTRLVLDLPADKELRVEDGLVLASELLPAQTSSASPELRRWEIALAPSSMPKLRIVETRRAADTAPTLVLREDISYSLAQRGIDFEADWWLSGPIDEHRELRLPLPDGAQLASVETNGQSLKWHLVSDDLSGAVDAIIELPEPDASLPRKITLRGWQTLRLDQQWLLPKLRPEGAYWQSGTVRIRLAPPLELISLDYKECVQTSLSDDEDGGEIHTLAMYAPTAQVEVTVARRQPQAVVRVGSALTLTEPDVNGRLVTNWRVDEGSIHTLRGKLAKGWEIESVETMPADARGEWFVFRRPEGNTIEVQLARSVRPGREITLVVTGRLRRAGAGEVFPADMLRMVRWSAATTARHLVSFQAAEPYGVEAVGNLPAIMTDALLADEQALLGTAAGNPTTFDVTRAGSRDGLALVRKRGQYEAEVEIDVATSREQIATTNRLIISPTADAVERLLVYATEPLGDDVRWSEEASAASLIAERVAENDPARASLPRNGEVWLLRLPRPMAKTVSIAAHVTTPLSANQPLPLLALPEAQRQTGRVSIRGDNGAMPAVEPQHMQSIPLPLALGETSDSSVSRSMRAAFRYEPTDLQLSGRVPQLWLSPPDAQQTSLLVARRVILESYFSSNGQASHSAMYVLEKRGAANIELRIPDGALMRRVSIDGRTVEIPVGANSPTRFSLPVHSGGDVTTIEFVFDTARARLSAGSSLLPPWIHQDVAVLSGEWTFWLPAEFSTSGAELVEGAEDLTWRERLFGPLGRPQDRRVFHPLRLRDWSRALEPITTPWSDDEENVATSAAIAEATQARSQPLGWRRYHQSFVAAGPAPASLTHPPAVGAWSVVMLLLAMVAGRWLHQRHVTLFVTLMAVAAASALLLPVAFAPIATGTLWGLALSLVALWPSRKLFGDTTGGSWSGPSTVGVATTLLLLVMAGQLLATPPTDGEPSQRPSLPPAIEPVLIPMTTEGHPAGSKYYVSDLLLRELLRGAQHRNNAGHWLIHGSTYVGDLRERNESSGVVADDWTLSFDVETLARATKVVLPIIREQATWSETAMLDGIPTPLEWRNDGASCTVTISEPGRYILTLTCVPNTGTLGRYSAVRLSVPPIPGATLRLEYPPTLSGLRVAGVELASANVAAGAIEHALGPIGQLEVQWTRTMVPAAGAQNLRVVGMRWLRVGAEHIDLVAKYVLEGSGRRPEVLTVAFDRRWQFMPHDMAGDVSVAAEPDQKQSVQIPLPDEDSDRQEVTLRWRLAEGTTFGRLQLPPIELVSLPVTHRWLAVSTDRSLECEVSGGATSAGSANEFLAMWGEAGDPPPQLVLSDFRTSVPWSLSVRPRQREASIEEVLHVAAGRRVPPGRLRVAYQADVVPSRPQEFQFSLVVPAQLSIDEVTLSKEQGAVPVRWARPTVRRLNVFFQERVTSEYRLTVRGSVPVPPGGVTELPRIAAATSPSSTGHVQLYREEDALLEIEGETAVEQSPDGLLNPPPGIWTARPIGAVRVRAASAERLRLKVAANDVQLAGDTLTTLIRQPDAWWASFQARLAVEAGQLDALRLRLPASWQGPYTIDSAVPAAMEIDASAKNSPVLVVRFAQSIGASEEVVFTIRGPISQTTSTAVTVPEIVVESPVRGRRFVAVPSSLDTVPATWSDVGVRPAELPRHFRPAPQLARGMHVYRAISSPFRVTLQPQTAVPSVARVRLADTSVTISGAGGQLIETSFVLVAPGLAHGTLQLPSDQELASVRLADEPAVAHRIADNRWRVLVGPSPLPRLLTVTTRSVAAAGLRHFYHLQRPVLLAQDAEIPVELSLWSVNYPVQSRQVRVQAASTLGEREQAVLRLDRLVGIVETAAPAAAQLPVPDGYFWYRRWAERLMAILEQAEQNVRQQMDRRPLAQVTASSEEQLDAAAIRLAQWIEQCEEVLAPGTFEAADDGERADSVATGRIATVPRAGASVHAVAEGAPAAFTVELLPATPADEHSRWIALFAVAAIAVACVWAMRAPAIADLMYRWPHVVGFLVGLAYWAWLWPSWLGLILAAISLLLTWRHPWPGRSLPMEGSTVLRPPPGELAAR